VTTASHSSGLETPPVGPSQLTAALDLAKVVHPTMTRSGWYRWGLGLAILITLIWMVRLLGGAGIASYSDGITALRWVALLTLGSFFRTDARTQQAFQQLAQLGGIETKAWTLARILARAWLPLKPLVWVTLVLWVCLAWNPGSSSSLAGLVLAVVGCLAAVTGLCGGIALLAEVAQRVAPSRPKSTLFALIAIPAVLAPVVPELPSLWQSYEGWVHAATTLAAGG